MILFNELELTSLYVNMWCEKKNNKKQHNSIYYTSEYDDILKLNVNTFWQQHPCKRVAKKNPSYLKHNINDESNVYLFCKQLNIS